MMEILTILIAVAVPAVILVPFFKKSLRPSPAGSGCGSCGDCPAAKGCDSPGTVSIGKISNLR